MRRGAPLAPPDAEEATDENGPSTSVVEGRAGVPPARPEPLRTVFEFELPRGYLDSSGVIHKTGAMRLATARDELLPLHDARVQANPAYLTVVLLGRVITRLGTLSDDEVTAKTLEELFASDLAFLQDLYRRINTEGHTKAA